MFKMLCVVLGSLDFYVRSPLGDDGFGISLSQKIEFLVVLSQESYGVYPADGE